MSINKIKKRLFRIFGPFSKIYRHYRIKQKMNTNPKIVADRCYRRYFGRPINWDNPSELNEKIRWMLYNTNISKWTYLADKYRVREFVKEKGYGNNLIPLYGVWDNASEIDFSSLPDSFVIKTNHGSGHVYVVQNKNTVNWQKICKDLNAFIKEPFGWQAAEIQYYDIPRRIIVEKLLTNDLSQSSSSADYQFYGFKGEPFCCGVFYDRGKHKNASFYDMNWIRHDEWRAEKLKSVPQKDIPCPQTFNEMKDACRGLASEFPFVRMDFYEAEGKMYFGEFTFTPSRCSGGSLSLPVLMEMGNMLELPSKMKYRP